MIRSDSDTLLVLLYLRFKHIKYLTRRILVAGIDRYPRKVVKAMSKKKIEKRTKIKPFIKAVNFNHLMPTRFHLVPSLTIVVV